MSVRVERVLPKLASAVVTPAKFMTAKAVIWNTSRQQRNHDSESCHLACHRATMTRTSEKNYGVKSGQIGSSRKRSKPKSSQVAVIRAARI
jgi:hypothetical protein